MIMMMMMKKIVSQKFHLFSCFDKITGTALGTIWNYTQQLKHIRAVTLNRGYPKSLVKTLQSLGENCCNLKKCKMELYRPLVLCFLIIRFSCLFSNTLLERYTSLSE